MRAGVFLGPGAGLAIEERPEPVPAEGQVLLRIARSGICGSDLHMTSGHGSFTLPAGTIVGHEYAGEVVALGRGVEHLRVGDRVSPLPSGGCGRCAACLERTPTWCTGAKPPPRFGGYAEYALADESGSVTLPDSLTFDDGALVEPLSVGLHGIDLAELAPGSTVVVLGAGPIGVAAVFWLRRMGAGRIVVAAPSRRRQPFAEAVGADAFVTLGDDPAAAVIEAAGGRPDVVVEAAGVPGSLAQAIDIVRPRGTVLVLGWCTQADSFVPSVAVMKQARLQFSMTYGLRDFERVVETLATGVTEHRSMITGTISLSELPATFETLREPNDHCKLLIDTTA